MFYRLQIFFPYENNAIDKYTLTKFYLQVSLLTFAVGKRDSRDFEEFRNLYLELQFIGIKQYNEVYQNVYCYHVKI